MKTILATLITVFMTVTFTFGQTQNATTDDGKNIILNSDGTWEYVQKEEVTSTNLDPNDCSNWIKTEEDKVSGKSYTSMKDYLIISKDGGKKGFGISMFLIRKGSIIFSIKAVGAGNCIDKGDKINILFKDGTRLELASESDFNCKGNATVYFGGVFGKKSQLNELKAKMIDVMRVWTSDSYVEETFEPAQAEQLRNALNCLTK